MHKQMKVVISNMTMNTKQLSISNIAWDAKDDLKVAKILNKHDENKILFATDSPWSYATKDIEIIKTFDESYINEEVRDVHYTIRAKYDGAINIEGYTDLYSVRIWEYNLEKDYIDEITIKYNNTQANIRKSFHLTHPSSLPVYTIPYTPSAKYRTLCGTPGKSWSSP